MAKKSGEPIAPEEIIELTDIIEHGPGAPKQAAAGDGVDLSFEKELEDLFAEPAGAGKPGDSGLPGLDDLDLPEDKPAGSQAGDEVDLDGLDALLAEAEKTRPGGAAPEPAPAGAGDAGLADRLEALERQVASLEERVAAASSEDVAALADQVREHLALEHAEPAPAEAGPAAEELAARVEELSARFEERLAALEERLAETAAAGGEVGPRIEELSARLEERLAGLEAVLGSLPDVSALPSPESFREMLAPLASRDDLGALENTLHEKLSAEIGKAVSAAAAQIIREEIQAVVRDME